MVVSDDIKALAILIPKTGTRSILYYMQQYHNGRLEGNHRVDIPKEYEDYLSFCVVRNPYTRIVSHWYGGSQRDDKNNKKYRFKEVIGDTSFVSYLRYLVDKEQYSSRLKWPFEIRQVDYMGNDYDYILKFENLNQEMYRLPFFKEDHELGNRNTTREVRDNNPIARKKWYDYYTQEALELVNYYYQKDFEYLNTNVFGQNEYPMFETLQELVDYGKFKSLD
jgi:hypothetical protein